MFTPMCVYGLTLYLGNSPSWGKVSGGYPLPLPLRPKESVGRQGRHFVYLPGPLSQERRFTWIHRQSLNTHRGKHRSGGAQDPHAHKNKIGTSTPPSKKPQQPPLKGGMLWALGFSSRKNKKCQAPIKSARPFPAPELRAEILWTSRFFWVLPN